MQIVVLSCPLTKSPFIKNVNSTIVFFRYAISSDRSGGFALDISVKYLTNKNVENTAD
jgi:hypothetical protein